MIKIATGYCGPGGSTVVFNSLVNLFNENDMPACLYGRAQHKWDGIDCEFKDFNELLIKRDDILIYHFMQLSQRFVCKKQILSCHETNVFKIKDIPGLEYDAIHFVSQFQKDWQGVDGVVIPNPIRKFKKIKKDWFSAGIIGSIDPNKRVHESILRAKKDGFTTIRLYGRITDFNYFYTKVEPLLSTDVSYNGVATDMDKIYAGLSHVYHSPELETYNLIKAECAAAGVTYVGNEGNDTKAEIWSNDRILEAWKSLIA